MPVKAKRLSKDAFHAAFGTEGTVRSEAEKYIAQAKAEAENLREIVAAEENRLGARLQTISDAELKQFIDVEAIERSAEAFAAILTEAARIRTDFEALEPWLSGLVETALRKIIGTFDDADLVSRIVREGMAEMDPRDTITIRVHPGSLPATTEAMARFTDRFAAVGDVGADAGLAPGQIFLEGRGGFVDVSIETQLSALISGLQAEVSGDRDA